MNLEQVKNNAQLMKSKGLDEKIIKISKEAYEKAKQRIGIPICTSIGNANTHLVNEKPIAEILELFGGSVKGINVLDLGCGNGRENTSFNRGGNFMPLLSTALAYLGANVTGIDYATYRDDEQRKFVSEKWGFLYKDIDLTRTYLFQSDEYKGIFENKDLIIARSLLNLGLKCPETGSCATYDGLEEWELYTRMIRNVQKLNKKDSIYNLEIPNHNNFRYGMQEIDKKHISDKEKWEEQNNYLVNAFEKTFGKIIYGEKKSGQQVFTINN